MNKEDFKKALIERMQVKSSVEIGWLGFVVYSTTFNDMLKNEGKDRLLEFLKTSVKDYNFKAASVSYKNEILKQDPEFLLERDEFNQVIIEILRDNPDFLVPEGVLGKIVESSIEGLKVSETAKDKPPEKPKFKHSRAGSVSSFGGAVKGKEKGGEGKKSAIKELTPDEISREKQEKKKKQGTPVSSNVTISTISALKVALGSQRKASPKK